MADAPPRLLFLVSEDWYFISHRLHLAKAAQAAGFDVAIATRIGLHGDLLDAAGLRVFPLSLQRRSRNPIGELMALREIVGIYRSFKPQIVHHVALKPTIYGSVAAKIAGVPIVINALAGLGYVFTSREFYARLLQPVVLAVFRSLFRGKHSKVIFQNADDRQFMIRLGVVRDEQALLIRGAGVDVKAFFPEAPVSGRAQVVFPARMLFDKGLSEFVAAARLLKSDGSDARFILVGEPDDHNPASADTRTLNQWVAEGAVEWWGRRDDMPLVLRQATLVCLPSYREGLPKVLLEAASSGKPIVATDVPGCREIVLPGVNGLLVPPRDSRALAFAIDRLLRDSEMSERFGRNGRQLVEMQFSDETIDAQTLRLYKEMLPCCGS